MQPKTTKFEERLATANTVGLSLVAGALTTAIARSYTASLKNASLFGLGAASITMLFVYPLFLYKNKISNFVKEKELDTFAREREIPKKSINKIKQRI